MTVFKIILKNNAKGNFYKEELIFFKSLFLNISEEDLTFKFLSIITIVGEHFSKPFSLQVNLGLSLLIVT